MRARASQNDFLAKAVGTQSLMDLPRYRPRPHDPAYLRLVTEAAPVPPVFPATLMTSAPALATPTAMVPIPSEDTNFTITPNASCLAVVDELSEVLDGVRVVVRRRRNQFDPGRSAAGGSDVDGDLGGRKLPALTGFCALAEFDLDLLRASDRRGSPPRFRSVRMQTA